MLDKNVITMSFAPKDEHEAQIQFALERGIPATLSVIGTQRLTFPDNAFDLLHCARCRVHWDADGTFSKLVPSIKFEVLSLLIILCLCLYVILIIFVSAGGKPLLELNRILRPGGFFIWSATPVYRDDNERDRNVWKCS